MHTHLLNFFIVAKIISWLTPFLQVKVSVVDSAGGSFCWNYSTYAVDNVCCNYVGLEILLHLCRRYFLLQLVDLSFAIMQVTVFVTIMQLEHSEYVNDNFYCNYAGGSLLQLCRWCFLQWIMHMTVSNAIMQVTVSVIVM